MSIFEDASAAAGKFIADKSDTAITLRQKCSKGFLKLFNTEQCVLGGLEGVAAEKSINEGVRFPNLDSPKF